MERLSNLVERKSVLSQVRDQLLANKDVFLADEISSSDDSGWWTETVSIIIAPKKPIYDPDKLNSFMKEIIVGIKPSSIDLARQYNKNERFDLGKLYFDEGLGVSETQMFTKVTVYEKEALEKAGIVEGESRESAKKVFQRRTWVRVYPDAAIAALVAKYERGFSDDTIEYNSALSFLAHGITPDQLRLLKEKNNVFKTVFGLLGK